MKKLCLITVLSLSMAGAIAQEPADALRYSWNVQGGTARVRAIGGAMGSLGGDITSTFVNPAGLAFYRTGDLILSPNFQFGKTRGNYLNTTTEEKGSRFTWGTTGFVIGSGRNDGSVKNSALSIAYNRMADFNSRHEYRGLNTTSSYSQKYLEEIQRNNIKDGNVLSTEFDHGSSLAFNTFWIDTVGGGTNGNFDFQSRSLNLLSTGLLQQSSVVHKGGIDELALGLAVQLKEKWMVGGSIGVPILHYKRESEFVEADATDDETNQFNYAMVEEKMRTTGVGFNVKAGVIYKPSEYWRLGFAVHSPSLYTLTDRYETTVTADVEDGELRSDYSKDYNDDLPSQFKYSHSTPYKVMGSVSFVIRETQDVTKQRGFITADVEYINYKASSYRLDEDEVSVAGTDTYLRQLNQAIDNAYKGAFNFRAGGELKFTTVMVRLGAAYYGNPYKDIRGENGSRLNLSGGLGYRDKGFFVDLTYVHSISRDVHYAYRLANSPYHAARLKGTTGNVFLTVGFKI
jgi:hypothetical protein